MAEPTPRRRGHKAASARILTAGLSSAAAFGMVAGMAVSASAGGDAGDAATAVLDTEPLPPTTAATAPAEVVVVIRRHWVPGAAVPAGSAVSGPAPVLVTTPAQPTTAAATTRATAPPKKARTRTKSS